MTEFAHASATHASNVPAHSSCANSKSFGHWVFYPYTEDGEHKCVVYAKSQRVRGFDDFEGKSTLYIVKKGNREFSVGTYTPYDIWPEGGVLVEIGQRVYSLDIELDEYGWSFSSIQDVELINQMLLSDQYIRVRTHKSNDTATLNYYSLTGLKNALRMLDKCGCGIDGSR